MSRSGSRSHARDSRGGSRRPRWDEQALDQRGPTARARGGSGSGARGGGSRGRPDQARRTRRSDDQWPDALPRGRGGIWGDEDGGEGQGGDGWAGAAGWHDDDRPGWGEQRAGSSRFASPPGARGPSRPSRTSSQAEKRSFRDRVRYWLTADAWQLTVLRTWPSTLRLLLVAVLLGSCGGLGLFVTRDQVGAQSSLTTGLSPLLHVTVGPGTPPPPLYETWTPYPTQPATPTATPAHKPTPTTATLLVQASLSPASEQCPSLAPTIRLKLDNSQNDVEVNYTYTVGPGPNGQWATPPNGSGTIQANAKQSVMLAPDPTLCTHVSSGAQTFSVQVVTSPGGQSLSPTFTVFGAGSGSTPTPTATPTSPPSTTPHP